MQELIEKLQTEKGKENLEYQYDKKDYQVLFKELKVGQKSHLVFYDPELLKLVKGSKIWHLDATFKAIPRVRGAQQLLTIMARVYDQVFCFF